MGKHTVRTQRRGMLRRICLLLLTALLLGAAAPAEVLAGNTIGDFTGELKLPAMSSTDITLSVGQTKTLKVAGVGRKLSWSSSKKSVAAVTDKGKVTAVGKGAATITARAGARKYTCRVLEIGRAHV